jgi:hypothetical protein
LRRTRIWSDGHAVASQAIGVEVRSAAFRADDIAVSASTSGVMGLDPKLGRSEELELI